MLCNMLRGNSRDVFIKLQVLPTFFEFLDTEVVRIYLDLGVFDIELMNQKHSVELDCGLKRLMPGNMLPGAELATPNLHDPPPHPRPFLGYIMLCGFTCFSILICVQCIYMGSGRNVFFQNWLKVVFTWGPATYSLLLAHTHTQVNEGNMDQTSIGAKL